MAVSRLEAFRRTLDDLGDHHTNLSAEELVQHIQQRFGLAIEPRLVPVLRASVRDLDNLSRVKAAAALREVEPAGASTGEDGL